MSRRHNFIRAQLAPRTPLKIKSLLFHLPIYCLLTCQPSVFGAINDGSSIFDAKDGAEIRDSNFYDAVFAQNAPNPGNTFSDSPPVDYIISSLGIADIADPQGASPQFPEQHTGIFILLGIITVSAFIFALQKDNLFRQSLLRTFTSPKSFFQDVSDQRFYQTSQTLITAAFITVSMALTAAGWLHANRSNEVIEWFTGQKINHFGWVLWISRFSSNPLKGIAFFGVSSLVLFWLASIWTTLFSRMLSRRCSLVQGLSIVVWSSATLLAILPISPVANRIYESGAGWLIIVALLASGFAAIVRYLLALGIHIGLRFGIKLLLALAPIVSLVVVVILLIKNDRMIGAYWEIIRRLIIL